MNWFEQHVLLNCGHLVEATWSTAAKVGDTIFCQDCELGRSVEDVQIMDVSTSRSDF